MGTADRFDLLPLVVSFDARLRTNARDPTDGGVLDDYVEAHVHGTVELRADVEAVVLDPSFRHTAIEEQARSLGVPVEWHEGRRLLVEDLAAHPDFRGPRIVEVGRRVAVAGVLDAAVIGRAALAGGEDPQDLKKVWHCVAALGIPLPPEHSPHTTLR